MRKAGFTLRDLGFATGSYDLGSGHRREIAAAHPEDRGANIVIFKFCDDEELVDESQDCYSSAGPACEDP